ncbi:MAG: hypothetical protein HYZ22_17400 [Chloroflexi bacterium]|nr:hypothetical protein [Chloroflexota bacterium]
MIYMKFCSRTTVLVFGKESNHGEQGTEGQEGKEKEEERKTKGSREEVSG